MLTRLFHLHNKAIANLVGLSIIYCLLGAIDFFASTLGMDFSERIISNIVLPVINLGLVFYLCKEWRRNNIESKEEEQKYSFTPEEREKHASTLAKMTGMPKEEFMKIHDFKKARNELGLLFFLGIVANTLCLVHRILLF